MKNNLYLFVTLFLCSMVVPGCMENNEGTQQRTSSSRSVLINSTIQLPLITIIPKGEEASFQMGSTSQEIKNQPSFNHEDFYTDDEQPAHDVILTVPYEIGKFEITNEQFCAVMKWAISKGKAEIINGDLFGNDKMLLGIENMDSSAIYLGIQYGISNEGDSIQPISNRASQPVHGVTWYGAIAYCNYLSEMMGLSPVYDLNTSNWDTTKNGFRLPTEAEWEYAARKNKRYAYAWGNEINKQYLNYYPSQTGNYDKTTGRFDRSVFKPVGYYNGEEKDGLLTMDNASPFGIYDMNGNVWEWCWDWYAREYYKYSPLKNPMGPVQGDDRPPYDVNKPTRVWRGCGWMGNEAFSRIAKRWSSNPELSINEVGFRIARSIDNY